MNQGEQYQRHRAYIEDQGLDKLLDFRENEHYREKTFDAVDGSLQHPFPPQPADLVRLHQLVRARKCFTALEFGTGYSTVVLADALRKNQADWDTLERKPEIRNRFMFQLFSVDASKDWLERVKARFPGDLAGRVHFSHSEVEAGTHNGQLCHYYKTLPNIVPDFIYLDGPAPGDVQGGVRGLDFQCEERTVMGADLLLMESVFLPGTFILVDGRTNNARFLARNFTRDYEIDWDRESDITTFELREERLGKYNLLGSDFF